jgi:acyl-CoA thioesterase-2
MRVQRFSEVMNQALVHLLQWLDLEPVSSVGSAETYRGKSPGGTRRRLFGGHVAAQALVAAQRCAPDAQAHSLHIYFLRLGDPHTPIEYRVERLRDGRSYSARLVRAVQHGEEILVATASFVKSEQPGPVLRPHEIGRPRARSGAARALALLERGAAIPSSTNGALDAGSDTIIDQSHAVAGLAHQISAPVVPPPAACMSWEAWAGPRLAEMSERTRAQYLRERPIEIRPVDPIDARRPERGEPAQAFWLRAPAEPGQLSDDLRLHQALATYASDHTLLSAVLRPHGVTFMSRGVMAASVDHTIWFHRPFRMDQWLLYAQTAPIAFAGRGLALGHFFDEQGNLVASMAQEGVVRQL